MFSWFYTLRFQAWNSKAAFAFIFSSLISSVIFMLAALLCWCRQQMRKSPLASASCEECRGELPRLHFISTMRSPLLWPSGSVLCCLLFYPKMDINSVCKCVRFPITFFWKSCLVLNLIHLEMEPGTSRRYYPNCHRCPCRPSFSSVALWMQLLSQWCHFANFTWQYHDLKMWLHTYVMNDFFIQELMLVNTWGRGAYYVAFYHWTSIFILELNLTVPLTVTIDVANSLAGHL